MTDRKRGFTTKRAKWPVLLLAKRRLIVVSQQEHWGMSERGENAFTFVKAFTLLEVIVVAGLLVLVSLIFFALFKGGILASNRGQVSSETREKARMALDRILSEMRQAVSIPSQEIETVPPVILPGPGGQFGNTDTYSVGCSVVAGCLNSGASVLNPAVTAPGGTGVSQNDKGPAGFIIFSEPIQTLDANGQPTTPADPTYLQIASNFIWVLYRVEPASGATPAQLVRYTFPVVNGNQIQGVGHIPGQWSRDDTYFVLKNSREGAGSGIPIVALSGTNASNGLWFMATHGLASQDLIQTGTAALDPTSFTLTSIAVQTSMGNAQSSNFPTLMATLSSQVMVQGAMR